MIKPVSLRAALVATFPYLSSDPDRLTVFIDQGSIAATGGLTPSFECRYTCNVLMLDFAGDADDLFIALMEWVRKYQPDLVTNPDQRANGITYEIDILNDATADVSIKLQLTESVVVKTASDGSRTVEHVDDSEMKEDFVTSVAVPWNDPVWGAT